MLGDTKDHQGVITNVNPGIEKKNKTQSARFQHPINNTEKQRQRSILLTHIYDRTFSRLDTDISLKDDRVKLILCTQNLPLLVQW